MTYSRTRVYAYDNAGRRIRTSGSFARINPSANSNNTEIDAANRLTVGSGQSLIPTSPATSPVAA
ncbi:MULTISPECIES: hypothetical protein [Collimonas]|uniref:hypothetical protein n=1 Tax=Collimonas TaxID=202907 RepID=UPI00077851E2|nr:MULTISPECIES: hypothetical protein [Collimonas]